MKTILLTILLSLSAIASASPDYADVKISKVVMHGDPGIPIVFTVSTGDSCFIAYENEKLYTLVLSLYTSQNDADIYCSSVSESIMGLDARQTHAIIAK